MAWIGDNKGGEEQELEMEHKDMIKMLSCRVTARSQISKNVVIGVITDIIIQSALFLKEWGFSYHTRYFPLILLYFGHIDVRIVHLIYS